MKTYNAYVYKFVYYLNDLTKKWLAATNKDIKENGIDIITCNKDKSIHIRYDNAQAQYSEEVKAQIDKIKAENEPINKGEKIAKIIVDNIDENTKDKVKRLLDKAMESNDRNEVKAASGIANAKSNR